MMDLFKEAWHEDPGMFVTTCATGLFGGLMAVLLLAIAFVW